MSTSNFVDSWLQMFTSAISGSNTRTPSINFPGSGSIGGFTYQPYTVWEAPSLYRGNNTLEQSIYTDVASPGKQIGKMMDVVLEIAKILEDQLQGSTKVEELKTLAERIEQLKAPTLDNAEQTAREDLDKLWRTNEKTLRALLAEYNEKLDNDSGSE